MLQTYSGHINQPYWSYNMIKIFAVITALLVLPGAQASTYLGKLGPFYENEYSIHTVLINKCGPKVRKLILAANANGKYAMPRFSYREILVELQSGKIDSISAKSEDNKLKKIQYLTPANDCVKKITINAASSGHNPGRPNVIAIEIWGEKI